MSVSSTRGPLSPVRLPAAAQPAAEAPPTTEREAARPIDFQPGGATRPFSSVASLRASLGDLPIRLAMDETLSNARVELTVPLSSFVPPLDFAQAGALKELTLGMPWVEPGQTIPVVLEGTGPHASLKLAFDGALPGAWVQAPPLLRVTRQDGTAEFLEVQARSLAVDTSAFDRRQLQHSLSGAIAAVERERQELAQARADGPARVDRSSLTEQARALQALRDELAPRRDALKAQLRELPARERFIALQFARVDGPLKGELEALASEGLALNNQLVRGEQRARSLEALISQAEGAGVGSAVNAERTELAELRATLESLPAQLDALWTQALARVEAGGVSDALLASSEFIRNGGQLGEPGTFAALLTEERLAADQLALQTRQADKRDQRALAEFGPWLSSLEERLARAEERVRSTQRALDGFTPQISSRPTAYPAV